MTEQQIRFFNQARLAEIPKDVKEKAIEGLKKHLPEGVKQGLKRAMEMYGARWWCEGAFHFFAGMDVRNLLRTTIGTPDHMFPSGNLDDYYIALTEEAIKDVILDRFITGDNFDGE